MSITKKYINDLTYQVISCAIEVHKHLGQSVFSIARKMIKLM